MRNRKWYSSLKFGLPPRQESRVEWDKQIPSHHLIMGLITVRSCTKMCWLEKTPSPNPHSFFSFFWNPISSIFLTTELTNKDKISSNLTSGGVPVRSKGQEPSPDRSHQSKGKILPKMTSQLAWPTLLGKELRGWIKGRTFES